MRGSEALDSYCRRNGKEGLLAEWDAEKNHDHTPQTVSYGSHVKAWWKCRKGHSWQAQIKSRVSMELGCPVCSGKRMVSGINDLKTKAPESAARWDPEKNGSETPEQVLAGSNKRAWWRCERGHQWQSPIHFQSGGLRKCPYCIGQKVWPGFNDLETKNPALAAQWDKERNAPLTPQQVTINSQKKVWWRCTKGHAFQARIALRNRGTGCPYCANKKVLAGYNDLKSRYPHIAAQWHPTLNGSLTPDQIVWGSQRHVWWRCPEGHIWKAAIDKRTNKDRSRGCPVCAGKKVRTRLERYDRLMAEAAAHGKVSEASASLSGHLPYQPDAMYSETGE